jgi:hypothetical protein
VADFLITTEGKNELLANGLPSTCYFLLSTQTIGTGLTAASTLAGGVGEITGTGYARQSQSEPAPSAGVATFAQMLFATVLAIDWPAAVVSIVMATTANNTGKTICAWHLQAGGTARNLQQANVTLQVTPTLSLT